MEIKSVGLRSRGGGGGLPLPFCVLEQDTLLPKSPGNTQEVVVPSGHERTTVYWHVKPEKKKTTTNKQRGHMISQRNSSLGPPWCCNKATHLVKWRLWV